MSELPLLVVHVTTVFAVALLGVRLASRARAAVRHLMLASAFGAVAVLPLATLASPPIVVEVSVLPPRVAEPVAGPGPLDAVAGDGGASNAEAVVPAPAAGASTMPLRPVASAMWLRLAWAVVVAVALVPVAASMRHLRTIRRRGRPWPEGTARLNELAREAGMRQPVTLLLSDGIVAPITGGLFRPAIILPPDAPMWSETHVASALVHELEHVRRRDWAVHLASRAVCALYWFHPLAWIAWRALRLEAERACDDAVLARADPAAYAEQLLMLARRLVQNSRLSALSMAGGSDLSSRIAAVLDDTRPRGPAGRTPAACIVTVASLAIAALAPLRATGPLRETAAIIPSESAGGSRATFDAHVGLERPRRFASRAQAAAAGCRFAAVKGPSTDACILTGFRNRSLDVVVYERAPDDAYAVSDEIAIPSWYETATLSLVDVLGTHTAWFVIDTEGMHGTGISQRVLLVIGWDGTRFRTAAAESLDYRCFQPPAPADYALRVRHTLEPSGGAPGLRLDYELTSDGRRIGRWSDRLRWSAAQFAFSPFQATADVKEPVARRVRKQIGRVRVYSAVRPLNPAAGSSDQWMGDSELMDVLSPACAPSLSDITREFVGKWMLDADRTAAANPDGASPETALVVGWDRRALTILRQGGVKEAYRLDGAQTTVPAGQTTGRATAAMDGERMVVTVTVEGRSQPLWRAYHLDGHSLVIEESDGAEETKTTAYYEKS